MISQQELQLTIRAARLYYEDGLRQQEVAEELGVSRPTVSRLLAQAREEGIVQIRVIDPLATFEELETRLEETFHLRQAVVVSGKGAEGKLLWRRLGLATTRYLRSVLHDGDLVGVGLGRTLHAVVKALGAEQQVKIQAVPLIGGVGQISLSFQVNELARRLAKAFGGTWRPLYAPAFVNDPATYRALSQVADVRSVIQIWPQLDAALVGIGSFPSQQQSSTLLSDCADSDLLRHLDQQGAIGDLCGRFFDIQGQQCYYEPEIISIPLEQLKALDHVIGVAGGAEKIAAILGALRGGYLNVLVTDTLTAQAILEKNESEP